MFEYAALAFASLFAIVDPFAAIPVFLAVTAGSSLDERRRVARIACLTATAVIAGFALAGPLVFRLFGVTLAAFQIAGGLVLLLAAFDMLRAQASPLRATAEEVAEGVRNGDVAITPLAVPLLAGPGAITTVITLLAQAGSTGRRIAVYVSIVVVLLISWIVLGVAPLVVRRLGTTGINVIERIMGLIVMVIGVQFVVDGIEQVVIQIAASARG